jgi:hypothetical protein
MRCRNADRDAEDVQRRDSAGIALMDVRTRSIRITVLLIAVQAPLDTGVRAQGVLLTGRSSFSSIVPESTRAPLAGRVAAPVNSARSA